MKYNKDLVWENITYDELRRLLVEEDLTNGMIAKMYGVTAKKVSLKRRELGLSMYKLVLEKHEDEIITMINEMNKQSKEWFTDSNNLDVLSKAIVNYIFRSGPIEDIHRAKRPLSEDDMKDLNIYMIDHIAGLLLYAFRGDWLKLRTLLGYYDKGISEWDQAKPEVEKIERAFKQKMFNS